MADSFHPRAAVGSKIIQDCAVVDRLAFAKLSIPVGIFHRVGIKPAAAVLRIAARPYELKLGLIPHFVGSE
jgi:hypothetical protein